MECQKKRKTCQELLWRAKECRVYLWVCAQIKPNSICPFNRRPAVIDPEFAVNALGMGADGAQTDHELAARSPARKARS